MKKLILLLISVACLFACEENRLSVDKEEGLTVSKYHISLDEALTHLDSFLDEMNATTKSSGITRSYSYNSIETISKIDIFTDTKSDTFSDVEMDDLMYIVNFDNNKGTAILSADKRTSEIVLCVTESGTLGLQDFVEANNFMLNEDIETKTESYNEDDFTGDLGRLTVPSILLSRIFSDIQHYDGKQIQPSTKSLSSSQKYGPLLTTKWSQDTLISGTSPIFNRYTPNNYPAGCVVIAVAQILMNVSNFTYTCSDGYVCKRNTMLTVANYLSPDDPGTDEAQIQAGKFVYELGENSALCDVSYGKNGSSSNANKAARTLEVFLLLNVDKKTGFNEKDETNVTNMIRANKPVYMCGLRPLSAKGHTWVVDGEWGDYYHINWGFNGVYDGYFAKGTFSPYDRVGYDNEIDDATHDFFPETSVSYTWSYRYITYDVVL